MPMNFVEGPEGPRSLQDVFQAAYDFHMGIAADADLLQVTPLHRMAGFTALRTSPNRVHMFDEMDTNTASGAQNRLLVAETEDVDGQPAITRFVEELHWTTGNPNHPTQGNITVGHVSYDPAIGYHNPEQALSRLAEALNQTGAPVPLTYADA